MINKSDIKIGTRLTHKILGPCTITMECKVLDKFNGFPDSIYVELNGDIVEVSLALVSAEAQNA